MKVAVIGGGSIGLLFASYLIRAGNDVVLFVRRRKQAEALRKSGLTLKVGEETYVDHPIVHVLSETKPCQADILIVTVKSYHVESVMPHIQSKFENTRALLFVQNGMQHIKHLPELQNHSVYLGVVEHGALKESDTSIQHTGIGETKIAPYYDGHSGINWEQLSTEAFNFVLHIDWYEMLSRKLHINSVINPLTALFRVKNGEIYKNPDWMELMRELSHEACRVLHIKESEAWKELVSVCKNTSLNKSSMLRDIEQGRETEIEAISGYLVDIAGQNNMLVPYQNFVYQAIKGMEAKEGE